jgi:hypothetical protein
VVEPDGQDSLVLAIPVQVFWVQLAALLLRPIYLFWPSARNLGKLLL